MSPLFKYPCFNGQFAVYPDRVTIEWDKFGVHKSDSINIKQITGVKTKTKIASLGFLSKGLGEIIITGNSGQHLKTTIADLSRLREVENLINKLCTEQK